MIEIVIFENNEPVGRARLGHLNGGFYLGDFDILPCAQKRGNGSRLIKAVNLFLDKKNSYAYLLNHIPNDNPAKDIYKNHGWREDEDFPTIMYYGDVP